VNNSSKDELIHDNIFLLIRKIKAFALREGPMYYQLVGEVKAHQGYDGYRV